MKTKWKRSIMTLLLVISLCTNTLAASDTLVPVGKAVGIHLCGSLVVVGFDEEIGAAAQSAGVRVGDRIVAVNGVEATSLESLRLASDEQTGVHLVVERKGTPIEFYLSPVQTAQGKRIGLKVRDGITGIGTVTFYDPDSGHFGALGHSVNDPETGECIAISGGSIMAASVTDVVEGKPGVPGALKGSFAIEDCLGEITANAPEGIFGTIHQPMDCQKALPIADATQVRTAQAQILSNVAGTEVRPYQVRITGIEADNQTGRNFSFQVCDDALLAQTGGIVQGMSGSPVIQDGRLIGAVTHVLVDDPTRGYGIFIENMLNAA